MSSTAAVSKRQIDPTLLRAARKKKQLSQESLAAKIGLTRHRYNGWENNPPLSYDYSVMEALLRELAVSFDEITREIGELESPAAQLLNQPGDSGGVHMRC